jgi:Holliday junction resolvasome RuvABC endonuclease subunit
MKFSNVVTPKAQRVLGIDPSTKSVAWCLLDGSVVLAVGEESLGSGSLYERMREAYTAAQRIVELKPDFVAIESAVYVNNRQVVVKLAYFYGIIMGVLAHNEILFEDVPPITWEAWIGNPGTTRAQKAKFRKENPGQTKGWYTRKLREARKQRTIDWVEKTYGFVPENDNIADAVGIAAYGREVLTRG